MGSGAEKGDSLSSPSDIQSFHIPTAWTDSICLKCSFSFLPRKPLNILPCSLKQEALIQVSSCHTALFIVLVKCGSNSSSRADRRAPIKPTFLSRIPIKKSHKNQPKKKKAFRVNTPKRRKLLRST